LFCGKHGKWITEFTPAVNLKNGKSVDCKEYKEQGKR
jgi:hypothetical protein